MDSQATRCVFHKRFRCSISSGVSEIGMMVKRERGSGSLEGSAEELLVGRIWGC